MKYSNLFLVIIFLLSFCQKLKAQEESYFNLNIDNGLPSNHVYGAITDRHGYLWMATPKGVARYNGYDLKIFNISEGLPYEDIWEILEDRKGRIWLGNISDEIGYIYNNKYYKAFIKDFHNTIYPRDIQLYKDGIIFFSRYISNHPTVYGEKNDTIFPMFDPTSFLETHTPLEEYFISPKGTIVGNQNGYIYDIFEKNNKFFVEKKIKIDTNMLNEMHKTGARHVLTDHFSYNSFSNPYEFWTMTYDSSYCEKISLKNYGVNEPLIYIYIPKDGNIAKYFFVFTKHYILKFQENSVIKFISTSKLPSIIDGSGLTVYNNDRLWGKYAGTSTNGMYLLSNPEERFIKKNKIDIANCNYLGEVSGDECLWWNNITKTLINIKNKDVIKYEKHKDLNDVTNLVKYNKDTALLLGSKLYLYNAASNNVMYALDGIEQPFSGFMIDKYNIFVTTAHGLCTVNIPNNVQMTIDKDRYNDISYDSLRKNLWAYNSNKIFEHNIINNKDSTFSNNQLYRFGSKRIEKILIDNRYGNVFIKEENGLVIYNPEKNRYLDLLKNYNLKEATIDIYGGKLIVIGPFGIIFNKISGIDQLSRPLLYANIKSQKFNYVYNHQIAWGKILLSTDKGTYEVNIPSDSEIINSRYDSALFQYKFILDYRDSISNIVSNDTIVIDQKNLRLQFDVINPHGNGQLKYTYELPGDSTWHNLNANELTLPYLSPTNYYKISIAAHDNVWRSDDIMLYVYIKPYWWQSHTGKKIVWGSIIILILVFLTAIILITKKLVLRATQKRNIQMELELKSIYSQINPHFIFNTLNSALLLVSKNRMEEAYVHIAKFSKLLRSYIKSSRNKLITLSEEIVNLKNYIELQQTRFKNKFEYSIEVDEHLNIGQIKIPSLLLQPFVENAINHGILNKQSKGNLKIVFKLSEKQNEIICVIEDDGVGRKISKQINESNMEKDESYGNIMIKDLVSIFNKYEQMNIEISYIDKEYPLTGTIVSIQIKKLS